MLLTAEEILSLVMELLTEEMLSLVRRQIAEGPVAALGSSSNHVASQNW